ncbi:hypothetical protein B0H19DRAFT_1272231 [Mycena capillaripes]|nr:hypothetical protein B0H19DRAFT_1272231 [Mycena capillaripes]
MYLFVFVACPLARLLDLVLGTHETHTHKKVKCFLAFHRTGDEPLRDEEIGILNGVLELSIKTVEEIMMLIKDAVISPADALLDDKLVETIFLSGYSRFPVHEAHYSDSFIHLLVIERVCGFLPCVPLVVKPPRVAFQKALGSIPFCTRLFSVMPEP